MKVKSNYVCQVCGGMSAKWLGRCPACGEWDSLVEEPVGGREVPAGQPLRPVPYSELQEVSFARIPTGNREFDRVLGGGLVPGSLVLVGGEPGIGKSTLMLQVADLLSAGGRRILYVAGEESPQQIKLRGERMGVGGRCITISPETSLEGVLAAVSDRPPDLLVVDSIQTLYSVQLASAPGSVAQVRECAVRLLGWAKQAGVATLLVGHVTKDGWLAGPKVLEHIVDVVLYFEGDRHHTHKLLRTVKNRFGPANELGVFEMTSRGLLPVENPSRLFLSEHRDEVSGSAVMCAIHGSRPLLVEVQALVSATSYGTARRTTTGVDPNRLALLLAMLEKRLGFQLLASDVYVNVAGGITLQEPAVDLALIAAVVSSFRDRALPERTVVFGEAGLAGEVRAVSLPHVRVREAAALGFRKVVLPRSNLPLPEEVKGVEAVGVGNVLDFLEALEL